MFQFSSISSIAQSCPTLCDPMNRSTPGLPVHHQLLEFTQTHVHRAFDAFQPSHPLSSTSPPAPQSLQDYHVLNYIFHDHTLLYNQHFLGSQPLHLPLWFGSNKQIVNYSNFHCDKGGFRFGLLAKEHSLSVCMLSCFSRV